MNETSPDLDNNDALTSTSTSTSRLYTQTELFRPSLHYPSHPYDEMLTRTAERFPENEALIFKGANLSYRELDALVNAFANALLDLGIRKGQKVCLFMMNRPEYLISWFAATHVGATVSPINPS
jgi:acyl-CoA synthetase (AMP-forming)/AMP-acid ligase II